MSGRNTHLLTRWVTLEVKKNKKSFFEKAAHLGGFRSLTDFVVLTVQERAHEIMEKHNQIIASQRDRNIFFDALLSPEKPNKALRSAAEVFNATRNTAK